MLLVLNAKIKILEKKVSSSGDVMNVIIYGNL